MSANSPEAAVETYLTDEVRAFIGRAAPASQPFRIDAWGVRRFVEATNDRNPRYGTGAVGDPTAQEFLAPPTLLGQNYMDLASLDPPLQVPHATGVVGSLEWDFIRPIKIGEVLTAQLQINDISEKRGGSLGLMVIVEYEMVFRDTAGEVVARFRLFRIRY